MAKKFSAQVDAWTKKSARRIDAVMKTSVQSLVEDAQTVTGEGGRMRVDTGFLRGSGQASIGSLPIGPSRQGEKIQAQNFDLVITGLVPGNVFYFAWTAEYARFREYHDGFARGAAMNWKKHVANAVRQARAIT